MLGHSYVDVLTLLHNELNQTETEENWKKRQDLLAKLSDILEKRKEDSTLPRDFVEKSKTVLPAIVKATASERTTLSGQACRTAKIVIENLKTEVQPQLDIIMSELITLCGSTKGVNQKNANEAILAICKHAGYNHRLFYHVCAASRDKRIPPRTYAPEWLCLLIKTYRGQMDDNKDGDAARKAIYEGLTDGQVKVRENSRATFWEYHKYDAQGARMIMGGLNTFAANALRDDPNNPDKPQKPTKAPSRPGSALAQIRAQSKQRIHQQQQHRGFTPASVKPDDFFFGSLEDVNPEPQKTSKKPAADPTREKHEKSQSSHYSEASAYSRHGVSTQSRPTHQKVPSRDNKVDSKDTKSESSQVDARPLLSAPVRRGRIVATPMAPTTSHRPGSRGEPTKKPTETKDKISGRQTPVLNTEKDAPSSVPSHHRKTASRQEAIIAQEKGTTVQTQNRKNGRQTPASAEDEPQVPPSAQSSKKSGRQTPVILEDRSASAPTTSKTAKESDLTSEYVAPTQSLPLRPVRPTAQEQQNVSSAERPVDKTRQQVAEGKEHTSTAGQHVAVGKENTNVMRPRKKKSPARSPQHSPDRSEQRSPRRRTSISSAKRTLGITIESLRHGTLDALGFRRLRKLIESHPHVLITRQVQFDELFELLIKNLGSFDEITESRDKRQNLNHPAYNRHTMLVALIDLFQQYPQWPEPQPGMTLCALLIARCNHSSGYVAVLQAIDDSAYLLCTHSQNPLPTIDAVLDTLEQIEYIITTNDPIVTPKSTTTVFHNSLQSFVSDFGPERPKFATRLPIVMSFGLKVLNALLQRLSVCGQSLYTIQEDRLASYAEHLLGAYTSLIKRQVMEYCTALHAVIKPEKRFYNYFSKESDKNLIHYYVAGASGGLYGSLGNTGRVVMPDTGVDYMEPEPSTFDPGSEVSANWKMVGSDSKHSDVTPGFEHSTSSALDSMGSEVVASEGSSNWQVLGTTADV
ncbi:uncharacterized protein A1O9_08719 [Exophiala aquamarina CBS 119918]|uniref:TOG domain-containing protein n=1 Tax=Exophiala aquamarina CBS 119918 TaxID=1182545 RepID=A0A072P5C1_9EURO|nr:uncharacterized protein A1O9_08719 [Exophiala aquamarina CBS 119918]KEF55066.1 hypothetical protein A1O9_08719 [Exophiala aquamarina CBS 119918]